MEAAIHFHDEPGPDLVSQPPPLPGAGLAAQPRQVVQTPGLARQLRGLRVRPRPAQQQPRVLAVLEVAQLDGEVVTSLVRLQTVVLVPRPGRGYIRYLHIYNNICVSAPGQPRQLPGLHLLGVIRLQVVQEPGQLRGRGRPLVDGHLLDRLPV